MTVNVLVAAPHLGADHRWIEEVDPRVSILDGNDPVARDERLPQAEVLLLGFPVPPVIAASAPRLRWVHHTQAGVSNMLGSDLWTSDVPLTSSRGLVGPTAIAEYAMAGVFHFARGLDTAIAQRDEGVFTRRGYAMVGLSGATLGVVGLGGIGREVARIGRGIGMRVIATRRSVQPGTPDPDEILPASELKALLEQSDFIVLCAQLTDETRAMFDANMFAAMRPGSVFVNIARGEEVQEAALVDAVRSGHLRGALLDVHAGESEGRGPDPGLVDTPGIIVTPHLSASGQRDPHDAVKALFVENLRRYLAGEPLENLVDRSRGY
jgi:phosphoglycerate dehydrogenase-like enzyme